MKHWIPYVTVRLIAGMFRFMPFWMIRILSSGSAFLLHRIVRYRRRTAIENLSKCFPDLDSSSIRLLLPKVYLNLTDVLFETIKAFTSSPTGIMQNILPPSEEELNRYKETYRGAVIATAHLSNWEWCGYVLTTVIGGSGMVAYRPLKNQKLDKHLLKHRERSLMQIIPMREIVRRISRDGAGSHFILLIADQSPDPDGAHWDSLFNVPTAFFKGPAAIAQRYDLPVFFVYLERIRRSYYQMHLEPLCPQPRGMTTEDITHAYVQKLESCIRQSPPNWLWTHRRWKHKPPADS